MCLMHHRRTAMLFVSVSRRLFSANYTSLISAYCIIFRVINNYLYTFIGALQALQKVAGPPYSYGSWLSAGIYPRHNASAF